MDITLLFKTYIKTIKMREKSLSANGARKKLSSSKLSGRDEFSAKAKDILYHITKLKTFLLDQKERYINLSNDCVTFLSMSPSEREKTDTVVCSIITNCSGLLKELSLHIERSNKVELSQIFLHQTHIIELLRSYLNDTCKLYSEYKNLYVKRSINYHQMMSLMSTNSSVKSDLGDVKNGSRDDTLNCNGDDDKDHNYKIDSSREEKLHTGKPQTSSHVLNDLNASSEELTEHELQLFNSENEQLLTELNSVMFEVKQIEKKASAIAELQNKFADIVFLQDNDVQRIDNAIFSTTENIQGANYELRKTVQNNASFRIYILFFILVMSFTLLFLNWYND